MSPHFVNRQALVWPESGCDKQAAYWMALIDSERCTEANRRALTLWRSENSENDAAYMALVDQCLVAETLSDDHDILMLRRQALEPSSKNLDWGRRVTALAACLLLVAFFATVFKPSITADSELLPIAIANSDESTLLADSHIVTSVGEQITKMLEDGSTVVLNTGSEVRIQFTPEKRTLYLLRGQALFDVAHDADRPFVVFANGQRVTALGTQFEVRITDKDVQVLLLEGKVKIDELIIPDLQDEVESTPVKSVELLPGQKFSSLEGKSETVEQVVMENALNWKNGLINYTGQPLEDVIAELNRYSVRQIKLGDPTIGKLGISGTLKTGSIDRQAMYLAAIYDLEVDADSSGKIITINWKQK